MTADQRVTEYLGRELRDLHAWKDMPDAEVQSAIDAMPDGVIVTKPYPHQSRCMLACLAAEKTLLLLNPGTGKTKIALDTLAYRRAVGLTVRRALIVVPSPANVAAWQAEIATHQPALTCAELPLTHTIPAGSTTIATYARMTRMLCRIPKRGKGKKKGKWSIDIDRLEVFASHYDFVVFDESTFIKNATSLTTRIAAGIAWRMPVAIGMTGTPFGLDPSDLFWQFLVIDGGKAFGNDVHLFRAAFARKEDNYFRGEVFRVNAVRDADLRRTMKQSSIHYSLDECIALPPINHITRAVTISDEAREYYSELKSECRDAMDEGGDVAGAFIRMCQIATGFRVDVDDDGVREEIDFESNPKMDALRELIDEIPIDDKIVIFHWFIRSGRHITELLKSMGIEYKWLYSGTEDKAGVYDAFRNDPDVRVLIVNPKSGGYGLNLQVANYAIFYESPVSPIDREQAVDRVYRTGQSKPVFIYDIVAQRTVEEHILALVREGKNALQAVLDGARGII